MKYYIAAILTGILLISCTSQMSNEERIEYEIKKHATKYSQYLATLKAIYIIDHVAYTQNRVESDDIYYELCKASIFYGFSLKNDSLSVENKALNVTLRKPEKISTHRETFYRAKTHDDYKPEGDMDEIINKKLAEVDREYLSKNIKLAEDNARNFFERLAAKYGLQLNFRIED